MTLTTPMTPMFQDQVALSTASQVLLAALSSQKSDSISWAPYLARRLSMIKDGTPFQSGLLKTRSSQHHHATQQCAGPVCVEQTLESSGLGPYVADSGTGPETMARPAPMSLTIIWTRKGTVQFLWRDITINK